MSEAEIKLIKYFNFIDYLSIDMSGLPNNILDDLQNIRSEEAFQNFFRYYYRRLIIWANSIVKDPQASEDIVQDFLFDFWQNNRYDSVQTDLTAYCYRVIHNKAVKYLTRKVKTVDIEGLKNTLTAQGSEVVDWGLHQKIYLEIDNLPEKCREVFVHCVLYGKTYSDTAEDLDVSINTVRTHMTKAFKTLREKLSPIFRE